MFVVVHIRGESRNVIKKSQMLEVEQRLSATESCYWSMRDLIVGGKLGLHDRMPTVRSVADQLGVSRHVVWLAIKQLEEEGLIRRRGRSYIVKSRKPVVQSTATKTIAVLSAECNKPLETIDPGTLWAINHGINYRLGELGCNCFRIDPDKLDHYELNRLIDMRPQGVIAFREALQRMTGFNILNELQSSGLPVVVYGYDPELADYDSIRSDQSAGAFELVRHLAGKGSERILRYWCFPDGEPPRYPPWLSDRDAGYQRGVESLGLKSLPPYYASGLPFRTDHADQFRMKVDYTCGHLMQAVSRHGKIDAVMALTDSLTYVLAEACKVVSELVGRQVLVAGYDNYWASYSDQHFAQYTPVSATIDKDNQRIGVEMVNLLIDRIGSVLDDEPEQRLVKPKLVDCADLLPGSMKQT